MDEELGFERFKLEHHSFHVDAHQFGGLSAHAQLRCESAAVSCYENALAAGCSVGLEHIASEQEYRVEIGSAPTNSKYHVGVVGFSYRKRPCTILPTYSDALSEALALLHSQASTSSVWEVRARDFWTFTQRFPGLARECRFYRMPAACSAWETLGTHSILRRHP